MILVTGGCGYIGSHCAVELLKNNKDILIIDDLSNSDYQSIRNIKLISNKNVEFIHGDITDIDVLNDCFSQNNIESVFHFAGKKSISESYKDPLSYFSTNVKGTINLIESMQKYDVNNIIFSSSATVYGSDYPLPWKEDLILNMPHNPYAKSKLMSENILKSYLSTNQNFSIGILRYFNPIGFHSSGLLEDKVLGSSNLVPSIISYLLKNIQFLPVYGDNYDTKDGSGVRDYIHIIDLIEGHLKAYEYTKKNKGCFVWNLGSGEGFSVFEIIKKFEELLDMKFDLRVLPRREGDLAEYWADISKANRELNWYPEKDINNMVKNILAFFEIKKENN